MITPVSAFAMTINHIIDPVRKALFLLLSCISVLIIASLILEKFAGKTN